MAKWRMTFSISPRNGGRGFEEDLEIEDRNAMRAYWAAVRHFKDKYPSAQALYQSEQRLDSPKTPKNKRPLAGYVYLISTTTGDYKIGCSSKPDTRLKAFSKLFPFSVNCEVLIKTENMNKLESDLHQRFADKRSNGEWFRLSAEDVDYIRGLST